MQLIVAGVEYPLAQLGPDFAVLRASASVPPCQADIRLSVDASTKQWTVSLPDGIQDGASIVRLAAA